MKKDNLAFYSTNYGWFNTYQRPHHLAKYFNKNFNVDVINSIKIIPVLGNNFTSEQKNIVDRIRSVYILRGGRFKFIQSLNKLLTEYQVKSQLKSLSRKGYDVFYTWNVENIEYLDYLDSEIFIYDAMDDWAAFSEKVDEKLISNERAVVKKADIVLTVSQKLYEKLKPLNNNTHIVRNGVDFDYFIQALNYPQKPSDELYKFKDKPLVGYMGHIHEWVDVDLIVEAAKLLPDTQFVVIGPGPKTLTDKFLEAANILYLGPKPYSELISYISYFQACLIPFKLNLLNESTNPIKLYEYLGAGKPVVSTSMREVQNYAAEGVVYVADRPQEYAQKIKEAIMVHDDKSFINQRLAVAKENSWQDRADFIIKLIGEAKTRK